MPHLSLTTLEKAGWELLEKNPPLLAQPGELCKITIASVSPLENDIPFKDDSTFELGDQIYFEARHVQAIRPTSFQIQSPSA